jgi:hypothetical protein
MVRHGLARTRSDAFNILIEKGLNQVMEFWEQTHKDAEELEKAGRKITHGG